MKLLFKYGLAPYIALGILVLSYCLFCNREMTAPVEVIDDTRIQVHFNTNVLREALEKHADAWGTIEEGTSLNFLKDEAGSFSISAKPGQRFWDIFYADSAAAKIVHDYPHLFSFEKNDEICKFTMPREQGSNGYVVLPTWILVELLDNNILKPHNEKY